jgi:hypothetical protein
MPKRISGHALFHAAFCFAVLILFLVTFVLLFPLWRGLERGGEAAALVYSSPRHSAKIDFEQLWINETIAKIIQV